MLLNKFAKRDYSLTDAARSAVALDDELIEEKVGSFGRQRELQAIAAAVLGGCALAGRTHFVGWHIARRFHSLRDSELSRHQKY